MKVRKLDENGDMSIGHGNNDFYQNTPEAVAQNVMTRLKLWRGQWFLDTESGTPWLQEILGKKKGVDLVIQNRILGTPGVLEILEFESILDPDTRRMTITAEINTQYGTTTLSETV